MLPKTIDKAIGQPPISALVKSVGLDVLKLQVEYELTVLSALVSVGGNLTNFSIPFIADQLILQFPNESLADFKLCFQRGAMGAYGNIQRLDGVTIGVWFKEYLEEKYRVVEDQLMNEKDNPYKVKMFGTKDNLYIKEDPASEGIVSDEDAKKRIAEWLEQIEKVGKPQVREDLHRGKKDLKATSYPVQRDEKALNAMLHNEWVKTMFHKNGKKKDNWLPFEEWLKM